jgi:hypothetical protein
VKTYLISDHLFSASYSENELTGILCKTSLEVKASICISLQNLIDTLPVCDRVNLKLVYENWEKNQQHSSEKRLRSSCLFPALMSVKTCLTKVNGPSTPRLLSSLRSLSVADLLCFFCFTFQSNRWCCNGNVVTKSTLHENNILTEHWVKIIFFASQITVISVYKSMVGSAGCQQ